MKEYDRTRLGKSRHGSDAHELAWSDMKSTPEGIRFVLGQQYTGSAFVDELHSLLEWVVRLPEDLRFELKVTKYSRSVVTTKLEQRDVGKLFVMTLENDAADLLTRYPNHRFAPLVEIFLRIAKKQDLIGPKRYFVWDMTSQSYAMALNQAVIDFRTEAGLSNWADLERNFRRNVNKNKNSIVKLLETLLVRHSRVLIVRVDLLYKKKISSASRAGPEMYDAVREHRGLLLSKMREFYGLSLLGYVFKLECGLERGFHYHAIAFLDGSKHREGISHGQIIGEMWDTVTRGAGSYNNCNLRSNNYRFPGVGMISYADDVVWLGFEKVANYLTKPDYHMKFTAPPGHRTLHMSCKPAKTEIYKSKGRPRRKEMSSHMQQVT